jgi:murein DD-endopeptidase MepM/ murein hydrolase activator NlpD
MMNSITRHKGLCVFLLMVLIIIIMGYSLPEKIVIPVKGATISDWNHGTFWHPWGKSGVHKGIDIFAKEGTPVIAACTGLVVYAGRLSQGGNVVSILGPKWRIHYYAHMGKYCVQFGQLISKGSVIGTVGCTGNAVGKSPHLHYSIISQIPMVGLFKLERYGFERMFYLNPHDKLIKSNN